MATHQLPKSLAAAAAAPPALAAEAAAASNALAAAARSSLPSFLLAHAAAVSARPALAAAAEAAEPAAAALASLPSALDALAAAAQTAAASRVRLATASSRLPSVADLLDAPSLFDSLVRASLYEDALDLHAFTTRLPSRLPSSAIASLVASQLSHAASLLLSHLLALLRGPVKLPLAIRVIGYLRRIPDAFSDYQLRLVFLQQRDAFLLARLAAAETSAIASSVPSNNASSAHEQQGSPTVSVEILKRHIEVSREVFFDIVTHYKAIFSDSHSSHINSSSLLPAKNPKPITFFLKPPTPPPIHTILPSYAIHVIQRFSSVLRTHLVGDWIWTPSNLDSVLAVALSTTESSNNSASSTSKRPRSHLPASASKPHSSRNSTSKPSQTLIDDVSSVNSIHTQTMYYGMSLGRVGLDFRQIVAPIFEQAVERIIKSIISRGVGSFVRWAVHSKMASGMTVPSAALSSLDPLARRNRQSFSSPSTSSLSSTTTTTTTRQPPFALMAHPPLGSLLNSILTAWNQLRIFPVLSIRHPIGQWLAASFAVIARTIATIVRSEWSSWPDNRRADLEDFCRAFSDVLVPFAVQGLEECIYSSTSYTSGMIDIMDTATEKPADAPEPASGKLGRLMYPNGRIDTKAVCADIDEWAKVSRRRAAAASAASVSISSRSESSAQPEITNGQKSNTDDAAPVAADAIVSSPSTSPSGVASAPQAEEAAPVDPDAAFVATPEQSNAPSSSTSADPHKSETEASAEQQPAKSTSSSSPTRSIHSGSPT